LMDGYESIHEIFLCLNTPFLSYMAKWNPWKKGGWWSALQRQTNHGPSAVIEVGVNIPNASVAV
jgi:hypothetical protein